MSAILRELELPGVTSSTLLAVVAEWPDGASISRLPAQARLFVHRAPGMLDVFFEEQVDGTGRFMKWTMEEESPPPPPDKYRVVDRRFRWTLDAIGDRPARTNGRISICAFSWLPRDPHLVVVRSRRGRTPDEARALDALRSKLSFEPSDPLVRRSLIRQISDHLMAWNESLWGLPNPPDHKIGLDVTGVGCEPYLFHPAEGKIRIRKTAEQLNRYLTEPQSTEDEVNVVEEGDLDAWVQKNTEPGTLTVDQETVQLFRSLGEPLPFRSAWPQLLAWAHASS